MKKLLITILFLITSNTVFAKSDVDIYKDAIATFNYCLNSPRKPKSRCAEDLQLNFGMMNDNGILKPPSLRKAYAINELIVRVERGDYKNNDAQIHMKKIDADFERELMKYQQQTIYVEQDNTQQLLNQANQMANPQNAPVAPPPRIPQPSTLNRNCGSIINPNGSYGGFITCN